MKKTSFQTILLILMALAGTILILYPAVANWLYELRQDGVVSTYQTAVDSGADNGTQSAALDAARLYNAELCANSSGIVTQYQASLDLDGAILATLDITGSGVIAYLNVPAINTYLPVYYGTDNDALQTGIGVLEYSSLPVGGLGSHTILCGHSGISTARIFSDLPEMVVGDVFFLHVLGETLAYEVDQIVTVLPEDLTEISIDPDEDYCTLLTCTPFGINTHRLLVRGTRIDYKAAIAISEDLPDSTAPTASTWANEYLQALLWGLVLLAALFMIWKIGIKLRSKSRKEKNL